VLAEGITGPEEALALGERLLAELPTPASMGIALATSADANADALVREADAAMYRVKRRGGGAVELSGDG
jgi:GGDEF domain-containing protein